MPDEGLLPTALFSLLLLLALGGYWVGTRAVAAWRRHQPLSGEDDAAPAAPDTPRLEERLDALERRIAALETTLHRDDAAPSPAPDESRLSRREMELLLALDRRDEA